MTPPVIFPIGDRPEIPADDAIELAELLNQKGMASEFETAGFSLAAVVLAAKIWEQAEAVPNSEPLPELELDEYELIALSRLLATEPWPKSRPWFDHFQYEVNRQVGPVSK
jgi:hypothetical protein